MICYIGLRSRFCSIRCVTKSLQVSVCVRARDTAQNFFLLYTHVSCHGKQRRCYFSTLQPPPSSPSSLAVALCALCHLPSPGTCSHVLSPFAPLPSPLCALSNFPPLSHTPPRPPLISTCSLSDLVPFHVASSPAIFRLIASPWLALSKRALSTLILPPPAPQLHILACR